MAEIKYLTPANYTGNEIRNFAHQSVAVLPDATTRKFQILGFQSNLYWSTGVVWYRIGEVIGPLTDNLDAGGFKVINVADAVDPTDAANLKTVQAEIAKLVDNAPGMLDTLRELAEALNNDPDFAATIAQMFTDVDKRLDDLEAGATGGTVKKFVGFVGDGTATDFVLVHNLGNPFVAVTLYDTADGAEVIAAISRNETADTNQVTVSFAVAPTPNRYRAVVFG